MLTRADRLNCADCPWFRSSVSPDSVEQVQAKPLPTTPQRLLKPEPEKVPSQTSYAISNAPKRATEATLVEPKSHKRCCLMGILTEFSSTPLVLPFCSRFIPSERKGTEALPAPAKGWF